MVATQYTELIEISIFHATKGELIILKTCGNCIIMLFIGSHISSVESQKGIIAVKRCSIENQKVAIAIDIVQ